MDTWRTAIVDAGPTHLRVRGHDVLALMQRATFTDLIILVVGLLILWIIISIPGSEKAVRLAMEQLILNELGHMVREMTK